MIMKRTALLTACITLGLGLAAGPTLAAKPEPKKPATYMPATNLANPASTGYPNGRPWQAMKTDFLWVKQMLEDIDYKLDGLTDDADLVQEELGLIHEDINALAEDVAAQNNVLDVQVSVAPSADRNADNDAPVTLFVHVAKHGQPVTGLTADNFDYSSAFPLSGVDFCGAACFSEGGAGVYAIMLNGDWSATSYAGALAVANTETTPEGDITSNGSSLVTFDIPAAPAAN